MNYNAIIESPVGKLGIRTCNKTLQDINFLPSTISVMHSTSPFVNEIVIQLENYFLNPNFHFNLPLSLNGTLFRVKVWKALLEIPIGNTITYGELAKKLKTSPRAIGGACRHNPIPIIVPCHRVVGMQHLGGYSGEWGHGRLFDIKKWLLTHEQATSISK